MNIKVRKVKLIIKGFFSSILFKLIHRKGFDPSKAIVIFGSMRSGSTWLAEIISSLDGHLQIFEPLHPVYVPLVKDTIPGKNHYAPVDREWQDGKELFNRILSGKLINSWIMSQASLSKVISARRLVVKIVRGNLLLEWFTHNMSALPPVLVIRHPCAVIASQINKGWVPGKELLLNNSYLKKYPDIKFRCESLTEPEEFSALAWCLRYHAPLMSSKPYPFVLVSYEQLVRNGEEELERVFEALKIPMDKKAIAQLSIPSDTVTKNSQVVSGKDPLAGWKKKLTEKKVTNILSVLKIFNMGFYTTDLELDYAKLMAFGKSSEDG